MSIRAHEAMLLGTSLTTPARGFRHNSKGSGCAIGMIEAAMGSKFSEINRSFASSDYTIEVWRPSAEELFPWMKKLLVHYPCEHSCGKEQPVSAVVQHLFDKHSAEAPVPASWRAENDMKNDWSLERIADWVKSVDPTPAEVPVEETVECVTVMETV